MMKGRKFYFDGNVYIILSDAMMHPDGEIQVVAERLSTGEISIFGVSSIKELRS